MKRLFFALMMLCVGIWTQAQTIHVNHHFWDGYSLYTVKEIRMGKYFYMTTSQGNELTLEKVDGKQGEYKLIPSRQAEECPFGAQYGWRVQHITQESQSFLAIRKPNGDAMWVLDQTTKDEEKCEYLQQMMGQEEPWNAVNSILLNRAYLRSYVATNAELRLLRNKILAYHGYRFQSKDLQEHFGKMAWYKPVDDNSTIKLDIIEQINIQLIKSEETEREENFAGSKDSVGVTVYINVDKPASGEGEMDDVKSVWLANERSGTVIKVCVTNPMAEAQWSKMSGKVADGVSVPLTQIATADKAMIAPGDVSKVIVEGCPDGRNIWTYIIDPYHGTAIQLPSTEGVVSLDWEKKEIIAASYGYDDDGRYSVNKAYSLDGKFLRRVGEKERE